MKILSIFAVTVLCVTLLLRPSHASSISPRSLGHSDHDSSTDSNDQASLKDRIKPMTRRNLLNSDEKNKIKEAQQKTKNVQKKVREYRDYLNKSVFNAFKSQLDKLMGEQRKLINSTVKAAFELYNRVEKDCRKFGIESFCRSITIPMRRQTNSMLNDAAKRFQNSMKQFYSSYERRLNEAKKRGESVKKEVQNNKKGVEKHMKNKKYKKIKNQLKKEVDKIKKEEKEINNLIKKVHNEIVRVDRAITGKVCMELKGDIGTVSNNQKGRFNDATKKGISIVMAQENIPIYVEKADLRKQELKDDKRRQLLRQRRLRSRRRILKTGSMTSWLCNCRNENLVSDGYARRNLKSEPDDEDLDFPDMLEELNLWQEEAENQLEALDNFERGLWSNKMMNNFNVVMTSLLVDIFPYLEEIRPIKCQGFF